MSEEKALNPGEESGGELSKRLSALEPTLKGRMLEKFALAALGSIPWVGGFLSAAANLKTEEGGIRQDGLQTAWLNEHEEKIKKLRETLEEIAKRFEGLGPAIDERLESEEYLGLVRKAFRI